MARAWSPDALNVISCWTQMKLCVSSGALTTGTGVKAKPWGFVGQQIGPNPTWPGSLMSRTQGCMEKSGCLIKTDNLIMVPINIFLKLFNIYLEVKLTILREEKRENSPCSAEILAQLKHSKTIALLFPRFSLLRKHFGENHCDLNLCGYPVPLSIPNSLWLLNTYSTFYRIMKKSYFVIF